MVRTPAVSPAPQDRKRERASHMKWIAIAEMKVSPQAQRKFRKAHAEELASDFDFELMGIPVVSRRDGTYWVLDGQHRVAALKIVGLGNELLQCEVYEGLSEADEATLFLGRNFRKNITPFDNFRIALVAGREPEVTVNRVVLDAGLRLSEGGGSRDTLQAVGALLTAHEAAGPENLGHALRLLRDAFDGEPKAFAAPLIKAMTLVVLRYGTTLKDERVIAKLLTVRGGAVGLQRRAEGIRQKTNHSVVDSAAGAIVDVYNTGSGGGKLESWWS